MKNLKLLFLLFVPAVFGMIGCSKSSGPAGPQGPAGPDSVIHSGWIQLNMSGIIDPSTGDTIYYEAIHAPGLTQGVIDSGLILTYLDVPDQTTGADNLVNASVYIQEYYAVDSIYLYSFPGGGATSGFNYSGLNYRYVVVAGTIKDGSIASGPAKGLTLKELQNMSYAAVQKLFGLPAKSSTY